MNNIHIATEKAVRAIESLLNKANWQDGYGLKEKYFIRDKSKPLFFRNSAPAVTKAYEVVLPQIVNTFYALYNVISAENYTVCNLTKVVKVVLAITIYADDQFVFSANENTESAGSRQVADFINDLLNGLEENKWGYSLESQNAVAATEGGEDYAYRTIYMIENYF